MKNILFLTLTLFSIHISFSQTQEFYGEGKFILGGYDLSEQKIYDGLEGLEYSEVKRIVKFMDNDKPVAYHIYMITLKDQRKHIYKLIKDPTAENKNTFIHLEDNNHFYIVTDELDSNKYLQLLSTEQLPNVPEKYRMLIQVILN